MDSKDTQIRLHILSRADVAAPQPYDAWTDPDGIAPIDREKLDTLLDNPLNGPDSEPMQILGARGGRIIGRIDLVAGEIRVRANKHRIFFSSNLFVPEAFRKSLMGIMLILKSQSLHHTVGAFGPSQLARPIYEKLKWFDIELSRFILIRNSKPVIRRYYGDRIGLTALSLLTNGVLRFHRGIMMLLGSPRLRRFRCQQVESMPKELDPLLNSMPQPVACHRSADWINWLLHHRFKNDPRNHQMLYLIRDRGDRIIGYFLVKIRFHEIATHRQFKNVLLGSLQDWMIFDQQAIHFMDIMRLALRELLKRRVDAVEVVLTEPQLAARLRKYGFVRVGSMHMMFKAVPPSPLADPALHDREKWFIRPADGENFFV